MGSLILYLCVTSASDLLASWSFPFQTREQLQADLLRCQAKIEDLEKLLVEKGQVSRKVMHALRAPHGSVPMVSLGSDGIFGVPRVGGGSVEGSL